jgi:hypothetical protein
VPRLCEFYPAFALQTSKKHGKSSVSVVEKCPDIPVAEVRNTFTHKQYKEQHDKRKYTERHIYVGQPESHEQRRIVGNSTSSNE